MPKLGEILEQVSRPEYVNLIKEYSLLGVRLEGAGAFHRETKLGSQISANTLFQVKEGDFIYSRLFAWRGALDIINGSLDSFYVSNEFPTFLPKKDKIDIEFLRLWFRLPATIAKVEALCSGSTPLTRNRFKEDNFLNLDISLPPLGEQHRIVARIEELSAKVEEARGLRREAIEEIKLAYSRVVSNLQFDEKDWTIVQATVLDKKGSVRSGPFGSQLHHEEFVESGVAAIGTRDVQVNQFKLSSGWYVDPEKFEEFKRYQVFPGDVLGTIVGASIGRFCVVPKEVSLAFTTKHIMALTLDQSKALPDFISYMLNFHGRSRKSLFAQSEGSAQPSLNSFKILNTELPLPSLERQNCIISFLNTFTAKMEELIHSQNKTAIELDALLPSILNKAFKGEL